MSRSRPDPEFLKQRLDTIHRGLKEAIHHEVRRLRAQGLPVYVARNGEVVRLRASSSRASRHR